MGRLPGSGVLAALLLLPTPALADGPDDAALDRASERFYAVEGIDAVANTCPADLWRMRQTWRQRLFGAANDWTKSTCGATFAACVDACIKDADASACLGTAQVFEADGRAAFEMPSREAYALAWALGEPSGCTNRAAGLRNNPLDEDTLSQRPAEENAPCLLRSFAIACAADDAWGCAMEGQAHRLGEGGPVDAGKARRRLTRACTLSTEDGSEETEAAPCRFARWHLDEIAKGE